MKYEPLISVVMSVYDTPDDWLIQSIESVLKQSYENFEFIIVDDCCCESNRKILIDFRNRDKRIVIFRYGGCDRGASGGSGNGRTVPCGQRVYRGEI